MDSQELERELEGALERFFFRFTVRNHRKAAKLARFLVSGGSAAIVNILALYILTSLFGIWYLVSSGLAFVIGFVVSFVMQKYWTFQSREHHKIPRQLPLHLSVSFLNLWINIGLMYLFVSVIGIWYIGAQVIASALIACESFFAMRIIFR